MSEWTDEEEDDARAELAALRTENETLTRRVEELERLCRLIHDGVCYIATNGTHETFELDLASGVMADFERAL